MNFLSNNKNLIVLHKILFAFKTCVWGTVNLQSEQY